MESNKKMTFATQKGWEKIENYNMENKTFDFVPVHFQNLCQKIEVIGEKDNNKAKQEIKE